MWKRSFNSRYQIPIGFMSVKSPKQHIVFKQIHWISKFWKEKSTCIIKDIISNSWSNWPAYFWKPGKCRRGNITVHLSYSYIFPLNTDFWPLHTSTWSFDLTLRQNLCSPDSPVIEFTTFLFFKSACLEEIWSHRETHTCLWKPRRKALFFFFFKLVNSFTTVSHLLPPSNLLPAIHVCTISPPAVIGCKHPLEEPEILLTRIHTGFFGSVVQL